MMKRILLALLAITVMTAIFSPIPASAKDLFGGDDKTSVCTGNSGGSTDSADPNNSAVCADRTKSNPLTGQNGLLIDITNILAYIAGVAAVIVLIVAGIRFVTSGGDPSKVSNARAAIINSIIGIIIIILARTLIVYILNRI
jgi:hypothetical protein